MQMLIGIFEIFEFRLVSDDLWFVSGREVKAQTTHKDKDNGYGAESEILYS